MKRVILGVNKGVSKCTDLRTQVSRARNEETDSLRDSRYYTIVAGTRSPILLVVLRVQRP